MSVVERRYKVCDVVPRVKTVLIGLTLLTALATPVFSQQSDAVSAGVAWEVHGVWRIDGNGAPIVTGDFVRAGSLLQPGSLPQKGGGTVDHSITILLPDGQLFLYECFTTDDCSRGFRVPSLYRKPEPLAVDMLTGIHDALIASANDLQVGSIIQQASRLPREEAIAVLGADNQVHVEGLAARMSNGHYTYDVRPLDRARPREFHLAFEKSGPSITLSLPSPGLYFVTIRDSLNTPRIDLFISAVESARAASIEKSYRDAAALMKKWNTYYMGWPVHDFQRAYLESLVLDIHALPKRADATSAIASQAGSSGGHAGTTKDRTGVTAEPAFSPKPGMFEKDVAVTLQCKTPGAAIHFTVDGSQPVASSPVFRAPIMVKGELTIKSFASVTGRKDSPVVTGIFRVRED